MAKSLIDLILAAAVSKSQGGSIADLLKEAIKENAEEGNKTPGVEGDQCDCAACNFRRSLFGSDQSLDALRESLRKIKVEGVHSNLDNTDEAEAIKKRFEAGEFEITPNGGLVAEDGEKSVYAFKSPQEIHDYLQNNPGLPEGLKDAMREVVTQMQKGGEGKVFEAVKNLGFVKSEEGNKLEVGVTVKGRLAIKIDDQAIFLTRDQVGTLTKLILLSALDLKN